MPEQPTAEQAEYNTAEAELFQLAVYGHHTHWPTGTGHPREYIAQVQAAQARYAAAVRTRALTEGAELLITKVRSHRYCAEKLLAARSIGLPEQEHPVVLCELPHHVAADTWCALPIEHQGWHEDAAGARWPNLLLAARTSEEQP